METKKIKMSELFELEAEINGFKDAKIQFRGLLNEPASMKIKYWLHKALRNIESEKKTFFKLRDELLEKYGEKDQAGYKISPEIKGKANTKFVEYQKNVMELLNQECEIDLPVISIEEINFTSDYGYPSFMRNIVSE
jgi:hypothetical protein